MVAMLHSLPRVRAGALARLPASLRGALWMCAAASAFALMITLVRHLTDGLHPLQVVFFRTAFGLAAMLPWLLRQGFGVLRTGHLRLHLFRALIGIFAMVGWFTTLSLMPLAEATALSFTAPIFTSVLAVLVLGEVMGRRRWSAVAIGCLGALLIVRLHGRVEGWRLALGVLALLVLISVGLSGGHPVNAAAAVGGDGGGAP